MTQATAVSGHQTIRRDTGAVARLSLRVVGGGLLFATGAIHLDLYLTGYRTIPTVGGLFLLQVISAFALGALVLITGNWLIAAAGAGFCLATLGGYLISLRASLFGFREVRTTAGITAGIVEILGFAALSALALEQSRGKATARRPAWTAGSAPWIAVGVVAVAASVLLSVSVHAPASTTTGRGSQVVLKTGSAGGTQVVTNAAGFTLYWFVPDTSTVSNCNGTCAVYWPPVLGQSVAGPGVTGTLGTIERADHTTQATFDGHPLYTYIGDTAAGQANGNNLNLNGGVWHEMTPTG